VLHDDGIRCEVGICRTVPVFPGSQDQSVGMQPKRHDRHRPWRRTASAGKRAAKALDTRRGAPYLAGKLLNQ
jgi:hypothetical protein